jgi:hypothetical protein
MVDREDKLAKFRKKPLNRRNAYRPQPWYASMGEAKEIFKKRYIKRGFTVVKVLRRDYHFVVSFGEDKDGQGKGPNGLKYVICNWPYVYDLQTVDEAKEKLMGEGVLERPKKKKTKRRKKRRKK